MTDRYRVLTVILDRDIREDDAEEGVMQAIRQIRGVASVAAEPVTGADHAARAVARAELRRAVFEAVLAVFDVRQ